MKEMQNRDGNRRTLRGVSSRSQLIEEAERIHVRLPENLHDILHVGGEGTEALLDGLLVSDIGKNLFEYRQLRALKGRDVESCLSHQGEQAHGFERYGLAAGVRSGDHQKVEVTPQPDIDGNHLLRIQQRMPPVPDIDIPVGIELRLRALAGL